MSTELRRTGIRVMGDVSWGTHFCHFYETKQDLLDTLVPYFKAGLESNEYCLWVVSDSELITVEEAKQALSQAVPDLFRHLSDENIEIVNGHDWYFENNVLSLDSVTSAWDAKVKQALARGYDGLRASADTFWLTEKDLQDFCHYEKRVNNWINDQAMTVMCTYPLRKSGASEIFDVLQVHQFTTARRQGEWQVIQTPELIIAKAEIRRLNDELQKTVKRTAQSPLLLRYGMAVFAVAAALIITLWMRTAVGQSSTPIVAMFLSAIMFSAWFGGAGPGAVAIVLSLLAIAYCFATPIYSFAVDVREIPRLLVFTLSAVFVGFLSVAQRSKAESLRRARDVLKGTVQELKRTNESLHAQIAERKRTENELREQKATLQKIFDYSPVLISFFGEDGRLKLVNREWERTIGWTLEEIESQNVDVLTECYPDPGDRRRAREFIAAMGGEWADFKVRVRDGRVLDTAWATVRLSEGTSVGIGQDITERKQAEEALRKSEDHLRLVINTIPTMAWTLRPDAVLDFVNQRWLDYTGLSFEEAIEDETRTVHPEDLSRVTEKWLVVKDTSEPYEDEMRLQGADGEYRWFLVRIAPLLDEQGKLLKRYGVAIDIEERKRAEEHLKASSEQLRALSGSLQAAREEEATRIAREIHDELGGALTSLKWDLEEIDAPVLETGDRPDLPEQRKKILSMVVLIDATINTVRRIASELRPIGLDDLGLVPAIELHARKFQDRTGIVVECDSTLQNLNLSQDQSTAIFRIFQEALTNILRHSQATRVTIQTTEEDGTFILTIVDNGRGITDEERSGKHTLGLLGMRERAHLIGGTIDISGSAGKGTVVTLRISMPNQAGTEKSK